MPFHTAAERLAGGDPFLRGFVSNLPPVPGDSDTGGLTGVIIDILGGVIGGRGPFPPQLPTAPTGMIPQLPGAPGSLPRLPQNGDFTLGGAIPSPSSCLPGGGPINPCCSGFHLDKTQGVRCVRNRRMNPLNPRALRRATRRLKGFERAVKTTRKQLRSLAKI